MKSTCFTRPLALLMALAISLAGCSNESEMSQDDIQYLSHLDQAQFFQRQGELKASTLEARSAIELQPHKVAPYYVILENLLTAGDALNAERQLERLLETSPAESLSLQQRNKAALISAEAKLMQGKFEQGLAALDSLTSPDKVSQLAGAVLRGRIHLANNNTQLAEEAFQSARTIDDTTAMPFVGLSRVAYALNQPERAQALIAEAKQADPDHPELWLWRAQVAQAEEQWQAAEEAYIKALEDIGQYDVMTYRKYETISSLIQTLRAQGKSAEAFVYEEILAKSAPGMLKSNLIAANEAYQNGDMATASRFLQEVLVQAPNHQPSQLLLGMVRLRQGRIEDAEQLLAPIVAQGGPDSANKLLAATRLQLRDSQGAREVLDKLDGTKRDPELLALIGMVSLASDDMTTGKEFIERSLALRPENYDLRLSYARFLLQRNDAKKAIEQARLLLANEQYSNQARRLIIQAHAASGDAARAVSESAAWTAAQPDNINALITRGQLSAQQDDNAGAMRYFASAAEKAPGSVAPLLASGHLSLKLKRPDEALAFFKRAVELSPDNRQGLVGVSRLMTPSQLTEFMNGILKANPGVRGPKAVLLEVALDAGNNEKADDLTADLLERIEEGTPSSAAPLVAGIYHGVATRKIETGNQEEAATILNRGRILFPEHEDIALQSAALAFREGNASDARRTLQEVKLNHPESPRPFAVEATYLSSRGMHKEASEMYQLALTKERSASLELAYARTLENDNQRSKAIESLEQAAQAFPDQPQILLALAMLYQSNGENTEAVSAYEHLLTIEDQNIVALNNLAWLYHQNNDQRASALARRAYELRPDSGAIADTYGWILFSNGQQLESVPLLEKAHALAPEEREIALHLVEAYKATGQGEKGKTLLETL